MNIPLKLTVLGGLGEIGLNLMLLEWEGQLLAIDAGAMFAAERSGEGALLIPQLRHLGQDGSKLAGVVITHAHEDHIGALPYLLRRFPTPVYGTETTLAFVRRRLAEAGGASTADLRPLAPRSRFSVGPFEVEPIRVTHSTPDSVALAISTPAGIVIHSGDFKIDPDPIDGEKFDHQRFAELGSQGVLLLLSDSTNIERKGRSPSETSLGPTLRELMSRSRGKFFLSAFSSHIHRIRQVAEISHEFGRRVAPLGRRVTESVRIGTDLGHLNLPPGTLISPGEAEFFDPHQLTFVAGGSQGEPLSAMMKLATETHPRVRVNAGDTVVLSSRFIPGNERAIYQLINDLYRRGAEVFYDSVAPVHVSGHAYQDELAELIQLTRPKFFVPIHGEFRHLVRHLSLAMETGIPERNCFLLEDGQSLILKSDDAHRGPSVPADAVVVESGDRMVAEKVPRRTTLGRS
jgi:ribonuclease J